VNKVNSSIECIKIGPAVGIGIVLLAALTGFVGYVDRGYRETVVIPGSDVDYYGGSFERGPDVHYSNRGFPEHWDQSGIMTFVVNQDGKIFHQNYVEKTSRIAGAMKEYNPRAEWTPVLEAGVSIAVSEK
jgi:hypothetical protein